MFRKGSLGIITKISAIFLVKNIENDFAPMICLDFLGVNLYTWF